MGALPAVVVAVAPAGSPVQLVVLPFFRPAQMPESLNQWTGSAQFPECS